MRRFVILMALAAIAAACAKHPPCDATSEVELNDRCRDWCDPDNHARGVKIDGECVDASSVDPSYHEPSGTGNTVVNNTTINNTSSGASTSTNSGAGGSTNTGTSTGTGNVTFTADDMALQVEGGDFYPQIKSQGFNVSGSGTFAMTAQNRLDVSMTGCNANVYGYKYPGWNQQDLVNALNAQSSDLQALTIPIGSFQGKFGTFLVDVSCYSTQIAPNFGFVSESDSIAPMYLIEGTRPIQEPKE